MPNYWEVKGYDRNGKLVLHTRHTSEASKDTEVAAWQAQIRKGTASKCEVLTFGEPKVDTIYG